MKVVIDFKKAEKGIRYKKLINNSEPSCKCKRLINNSEPSHKYKRLIDDSERTESEKVTKPSSNITKYIRKK